MSFSEGIFPDMLNIVIPIFKAGDKKNISIFSNNNVLFKQQFGFRQKHSTQQTVIPLVNRIFNSLDMVIGVFLDLKETFDTVDYTILL